ncbi:MAG: hypothetical protein WA064_02695 [Candidatus Moraniibacteriota bacterium]
MNQKTLISVLILLVAILGGTTVYFLTAQKSVAPVVLTPVPVSKTVPVTEKTNPVAQDETADWKLVSGNPKQDCSQLQYSGNVKVHGWYVWDTGYVEKEWMLKIADSDTGKFPKVFLNADVHTINSKVRLRDASPELEKELKSATKDNPKEITLKGYYLYCEGSPSVSVVPPVVPVVQDETVGWKNYTDTKLGFEFKHPNGWIVDKERTSTTTTVFIKSNALSGSDREAISVEDNMSNLTIDQILDKTCTDGWGGCERKDIIIAGEKGKTFSMGGFGISVIVVLHDGHKYTIETQGNLFNDSVLKTFQFTK